MLLGQREGRLFTNLFLVASFLPLVDWGWEGFRNGEFPLALYSLTADYLMVQIVYKRDEKDNYVVA